MSTTTARKLETRSGVPIGETKLSDDGKLSGYAVKYNVRSYPVFGMYREVILPGAFDKTLRENPDVRLLAHHDTSKLLARVKSGTLSVRSDNIGLSFEATLDDTTIGQDARKQVKRGDLDSMSFGFFVVEDSWKKDENGFSLREIREVELLELSLATFPQYPKTEVSTRSADDPGIASLRAWEESLKRMPISIAEKRLRIAEAC